MKKLSLVVFALLVACGKRGDPHPPVPIIPKATTDLVVTQRGSKVILTWSYPSLSTAGQTLQGARRIVVYRATESLPVPQAGRDPNTMLPGDIDTTVPRSIALFARVPTLSARQFTKLREKVDSIESAKLPSATSGARLMFEDTPQFSTTDGRPVRLTYAVTTETPAARSDVSNLALIVPLPVPAPPTALVATPDPQGVTLKWERAAGSGAAGSAPAIVGYNIYRRGAKQPEDALATPLNAAPVATTTYSDVPQYGDFTYFVRTVASLGPPLIESDASNTASATFKDLLPPPPPKNVVALTETKSVRLLWDPVNAPDLFGYNIYRYQGDARLKLKLTPHPSTAPFFSDISIEVGIEYVYGITSVDKNGNESAEASSQKVMVPRTP